MIGVIKDLFVPKSTFLTCQFKGHDIDKNDKSKLESIIKCSRCDVPLYIKNGRIHEFYSPEDFHKYKENLGRN